MHYPFAKRMDALRASEIREILKVTQRPEVISFAGGLPAPEIFPVEALQEVAIQVLQSQGVQALQYSVTEGFEPLRRHIARRMNQRLGTNHDIDNILITSGSQQALDFCGKLFLDEGDVVLCESPTYLGALSAFRSYGPRFVEIPTDDDGMQLDALEHILQTTERIKFLYVVPDFQNPTGRTWSVARRQGLIALLRRYEIPIIEDNPYGELRFEGPTLPSLQSLDTTGLVLFIGTFSKIFCPGLRIGWIAAPPALIERLVLIKQGADLHTCSLSQRELAVYLDNYDLDAHIAIIVDLYRQRRDAMLNGLTRYFPKEVQFTRPQGGLFCWVQLPPNIAAVPLLQRCLEQNVAFVPGDAFFPSQAVSNTLRLNYSNMPEDRIAEGLHRMAKVLEEYPV